MGSSDDSIIEHNDAQADSKDSSPASGAASVPGGPPPFLSLAYGYMPLVWGATLANYLPLLLTEVGRALPVRPARVHL